MKVNRALPHLKRLHLWRGRLMTCPFYLVGGVGVVTRHNAGRFRVEKVEVPLPQLPAAWNGLTITHLSDLHLGPGFTVSRHLPPVIDACCALQSDLLVMTGDWVDRHAHHLPAALPLLRELRAPLGVFGCLGNHDVFNTRRACVRLLRSWLGANLLINQSVTLERHGSRLTVSGMDYAMNATQLARHWSTFSPVVAQPANVRIVLAHDPGLFPRLHALGADLVLSGHTHGGQWSLTPPPHRVIGPMMYSFPYLRGLYREGNAALYVSRGLGQSMPIRVNNPPEITQLTLRCG